VAAGLRVAADGAGARRATRDNGDRLAGSRNRKGTKRPSDLEATTSTSRNFDTLSVLRLTRGSHPSTVAICCVSSQRI
jgi:hypothetical protein